MVAVLADRRSPAFAYVVNRVKKYVVTSTPLSNGWHTSEAIEGPVEDLVRDLKARPGGDIGVHGSGQLAQSLLAAGLVHELQFGGWSGVRFPRPPAVRSCCSPTACPEEGR